MTQFTGRANEADIYMGEMFDIYLLSPTRNHIFVISIEMHQYSDNVTFLLTKILQIVVAILPHVTLAQLMDNRKTLMDDTTRNYCHLASDLPTTCKFELHRYSIHPVALQPM